MIIYKGKPQIPPIKNKYFYSKVKFTFLPVKFSNGDIIWLSKYKINYIYSKKIKFLDTIFVNENWEVEKLEM